MGHYIKWVICLCLSTLGTGTKLRADQYFVVLFGSQDSVNSLTGAHTFATFVHAGGDRYDERTISWLPASGTVCLFCPTAKGRNYSLWESVAYAKAHQAKITRWGPYEIHKELYDRAVLQAERLFHGKTLYKALDQHTRPLGIAINCMHAVSDIDTDQGYLMTGTAHGNEATRLVAKHLSHWIEDPSIVHQEVAKDLGIADIPTSHLD